MWYKLAEPEQDQALATSPQKGGEEKDASALGVIMNVAQVVGRPILMQKLTSMGYTPMSQGVTPEQFLRDYGLQMEILRALRYSRSTGDQLAVIDGIFRLLGYDPQTIAQDDKLKFIRENISIFLPILSMTVDDATYDQLFGKPGSTISLAKGLIRALAPYGMDGESAIRAATTLHTYFASNPELMRGFTNSEISEIFDHAVKTGLITPTPDGNALYKQLALVLGLYASTRDGLVRQMGQKPEIKQVLETVPKFLEVYAGVPFDTAAKYIRRDLFITSLAPTGVFEAAVRASGIQSPIPSKLYAADDIKLRASARDSPVGNMVGATIRAVEHLGARGPLRQLYNQIKSGHLPVIHPAEWLQLAARSGINPGMATALLAQRARNKAFLTPEIINTIRSSQFEYDIAPIMNRIYYMYRDPEMRAGALAEVAERLGYRGTGYVDAGAYMTFLHSNMINEKTKEIYEQANRYADYSERLGNYRPAQSLLEAATEAARTAPAEDFRGVKDVTGHLLKSYFGAVPKSVASPSYYRRLSGAPFGFSGGTDEMPFEATSPWTMTFSKPPKIEGLDTTPPFAVHNPLVLPRPTITK